MIRFSKPFYGWYVVGMAFLSLFISAGATGFAFSVFIPPMSTDLGWPRSQLVLASSVAWLAAAFVGTWFGRLIDRHGARMIVAGGMLALTAGIAGCGLVQEPWQFFACFSLLAGVGRSILQNVAPSAMVANWFIRRRTLAFSLTALGPPASSLVYPGLTALLVFQVGWRWAWVALGMSALFIGLPAALLLIRRRPEDMGLLPDGDAAPPPRAPGSPTPRPITDDDWELREAVRSRGFWGIATGMSLVLLTPATVTVFLFPYFYDQGMGEGVAAAAISVLSMVQVVSRLFFWGPAIARLGSVQRVMLLWGVLIFIGALSLQFAHTEVMAYVCSAVVGLAMGGNLVLQLQVWPEYFGRKAVGAITGAAQMFMGSAAAGGPVLAAYLLDTTGGYSAPLFMMAGACATGLLLLFLTGKPSRRARAAPAVAR